MNMRHRLCAGAGCAIIDVASVLPVEGFTAIATDMHVRVLIMESNIRTAIVSVEITQMPDEIRLQMQERVCNICGVKPEHVWVTTTHSFAGPHLFPTPKPGAPARPGPGGRIRTQEDIERGAKLLACYFAALEDACTQAMETLQPAVAGCSTGNSDMTVSRNIETAEGWWLGTGSDQPCDKTVSLLRIDTADGKPLAALFVFGIRSGVMHKVFGEDGGAIVSSDLCGAACVYLEEELGGDFTAMFLCGAACDQEPLLKGVCNELDKDGKLVEKKFGAKKASVMLEAQGARLGSDVLNVWRNVQNLHDVSEISMGSAVCVCSTKICGETSKLKPARGLNFEAAGEVNQTVSGMIIGDFILAGFQPEMGGVISAQIRQVFPDATAAMAIMVNGSGKCLPDESAYRACMYQSQNTPFMPGSAEKLRDAAIALLVELKERGSI